MKNAKRQPRTVKAEAQWETAAKLAGMSAKPTNVPPKPESSKRAPTGGPKHASRLQPKQKTRSQK